MVESPALAGQASQSSQRTSHENYPDIRYFGARWCFWMRMRVADTGRVFWSASWIGEGVGIDDLVDAFMGGGTIYSDKQLVVSRTVDPVGLAFSGEIDVTNRGAVAKCLAMTPPGEDETHLDVSGLIFCDISGIRAFVDAAEARISAAFLTR